MKREEELGRGKSDKVNSSRFDAAGKLKKVRIPEWSGGARKE